MADYKDYYKILGVDKKASEADIKKAFKTMARKYHPDMHGEAQKAAMTEKFKDINEAYEVLSDKQKRNVYDQIGGSEYQNYARGGGASAGAGAGAYSRGNPFGGGQTYTYSGGGNPFGGGGGGGFNFHSTGGFEAGDFSDFFQQIFGGMGGGSPFGGGGSNPFGGMGGRASRSAGRGGYYEEPNLDSEADLTLSVEDAYRGGQMGLTLGNGQTVQVKLPSKIADGQKIKLKGLGRKSQAGAGDLFINIKLKPHPVYRIEGSDIYQAIDILPWTAALGGCACVPLPDGSSVNIKVPAGVQSGNKVKLSGKGLGKTGNMFVQFMINNPKTLTKTQKELFAKLAES